MTAHTPCALTERQALDRLMSTLIRWESENPVYIEMLAAATAKIVPRVVVEDE